MKRGSGYVSLSPFYSECIGLLLEVAWRLLSNPPLPPSVTVAFRLASLVVKVRPTNSVQFKASVADVPSS